MDFEEIVTGFVDWTATFITPDWGELVLLIPVGLAMLVGLFLVWTAYRWATAGPKQRTSLRRPPRPPAGVHMPGPSFAPVLAAVGATFMVAGVVAGGPWLLVGGTILLVTLLYWGREALRDYDAIERREHATVPAGALPARTGPVPEGVHVPPPSFRPVLAALGATILVGGLVAGGSALLAGGLAMAVALLGWLLDARREYHAVEEADRTGHLDLGEAPAWPTVTVALLLVLVAAGVLLGAAAITGGTTPTT